VGKNFNHFKPQFFLFVNKTPSAFGAGDGNWYLKAEGFRTPD
jgi:hypothetical protein